MTHPQMLSPTIAAICVSLVAAIASADPASKIAEVGLERQGLDHARSIYRSVSQPSTRVEFAYGLVLLKHYKRSEAIEHLQACRKGEFLPGWEAALRVLADEREYNEILKDLPSLAKAVSALKDDVAATDLARRLGRLIAAVELASESPQGEAAWLATLENLSSSLQPDFDAGYEETLARADEISERARKRQQIKSERQQESRAEEASRLEELVQRAGTERMTLSRTAEDWTEYLEKLQNSVVDSLTEYEKELDTITRRQQLRVAQINVLQAQLNELRSRTGRDQRLGTLQEITLRRYEADIASRQLDLEDDELRRADIQADVERLRTTYASEVARGRQIVGSAANRHSALAKAVEKTTAKLEKLAEINKNNQHAQAIADKNWAPKYTVRSLVPWNYPAEAARL